MKKWLSGVKYMYRIVVTDKQTSKYRKNMFCEILVTDYNFIDYPIQR